MADEIRVTGSAQLTVGGATISASANCVKDLAGDEGIQQIVSVGFAADQAIELAALDTLGTLMVENLDAANPVAISTATGGSFAAAVFESIVAGDFYIGHPATATLYIKATTAAVNVRITAIEA
jgi:hypothetical protein